MLSELSWWDGKQSFGFVFKREFFSWYLLLCLLIEFEVKISLYMLTCSPHIVSHYSLVGLITYFEGAGLWEVWTLTIWPLIFESPHIGGIFIFKSSDLGSINLMSLRTYFLKFFHSHKKEVVLCWALKEDWLYDIGCLLSHKNSKCLTSCCMIAFLSFWD